MLQVDWVKCGDDNHWCSFSLLNMDGLETQGIYVIWHEGDPGRVIYVGQGEISEHLRMHRKNPQITAYARFGTLRITWAFVPAAQRSGVTRYLAKRYRPLVSDVYPEVEAIPVNLVA